MPALRRIGLTFALPVLWSVGCELGKPSGPAIDAAGAAGPKVTAPSNDSALAVSTSRIDVSWQDNSSNESGFEVHRSAAGPNGTFTLLASTGIGVTIYTDAGLNVSTLYCYRIRAFKRADGKTSYSDFSNTACATTSPPPPPPPPPGPTAPSGTDAKPTSSKTVTVTWIDNSTNEAAFRIERSFDLGSTWSIMPVAAGANMTKFHDQGLASERPVCYRIVAYNSQGSSLPSNTDCTTPPAGPSGLVVTVVDQQTIGLSWTDNSAAEDGYELRRATEGGTWSPAADLPPNSTSFRDVVPSDAWYSYVIVAKRDGGYSDASNNARVILASAPPAAPSGANAWPWGSNVELSWLDNSANEFGFRIERSTDDGATWQVAGTTTLSGPMARFEDVGRTIEQQVCYRIIAFNSLGESAASDTDCTTPPAVPTDLVATPIDGPAITLTWTNHSAVADGYEVQRLSCWVNDYGWLECGYNWSITLGPDATSYTDTGLNASESYTYRVFALKDRGYSAPSNEASATTHAPPE